MGESLYLLALGIGATVGMLLLFKLGERLFASRSPPLEAVLGEPAPKNLAKALFEVGNVLGIFLIAASVVRGTVQDEERGEIADYWLSDILWIGAFGVTALVLYSVMTRLGIALLLRSHLPRELERGNVAAGIAAAAHAIATAIIVARSIGGNDLHSLGLSLVFFMLAQVSLHVLVSLFRFLTSYDDSEEIIGENNAAALSYGGLTIGVALIIGRAVEGKFVGWEQSLRAYGIALAFGLLLWPVRQLVVEGLLLGARPSFRKGKLDYAIARDRNVGMGALEGACYVAAAFAILRIG